MSINLGIIMDPIETIKVSKDSSFAMLLAAQARGWNLWYMELNDLWLYDGQAYAFIRRLQVYDDSKNGFTLGQPETLSLSHLSVILMRKDPPFDIEYIVEETSSDQIEMSLGWGMGTLIGTVGVSFNNFSA